MEDIVHTCGVISRHQGKAVEAALEDTPAVMIVGPRQSGKSTLARAAGEGREYVTFDDPIAYSFAKTDPKGFLKSYAGSLVIDEVQRVPELFIPLKAEIDRNRAPGRYLLTGSANVLHMPKMGDSLAGRMEVIDLLPFSQGEIEGAPDGFVDALFEEDFQLVGGAADDVLERIARGGFPEPVSRKGDRRQAWFQSYVKAILDRDVRDIANIEALPQMPRLFMLLAHRAGAVLNAASLAGDSGIPYTSLKRYLDLLTLIYLVHPVPAWTTSDRAKSLTKAPKFYLVDTGLLCHIGNLDPSGLKRDPFRYASVLENFVAMELKKQCSFGRQRPMLMHLRTVRHLEVDFVLEGKDGRIAGVEVRPQASLTEGDAEGLKFLAELAGDRFSRGVILYGGDEVVRFGPSIVGLPLARLWQTQAVS